MARLVPRQSYQWRQSAQNRGPAPREIGAPRPTPWLDWFIACSSSVTSTSITESNITKPNIDSNNYVGQLSRPRPSTCNSFHFHSLEVEFLESCPSLGTNTWIGWRFVNHQDEDDVLRTFGHISFRGGGAFNTTQ